MGRVLAGGLPSPPSARAVLALALASPTGFLAPLAAGRGWRFWKVPEIILPIPIDGGGCRFGKVLFVLWKSIVFMQTYLLAAASQMPPAGGHLYRVLVRRGIFKGGHLSLSFSLAWPPLNGLFWLLFWPSKRVTYAEPVGTGKNNLGHFVKVSPTPRQSALAKAIVTTSLKCP